MTSRSHLITAAVDAGRVGRSHVPVEIQAMGALGLVASFAVIWSCTAANHYLSSQSRIQAERGHRVVREGPYAVVRHPMYTSHMVRGSDAEGRAWRLPGVLPGRETAPRPRSVVALRSLPLSILIAD